MKIYHTKTQEDYDALMRELEKEGCVWIGGEKPTNINMWEVYKEGTCVICNNKTLSYWSVIGKNNAYPNILAIEYTARKTNMISAKEGAKQLQTLSQSIQKALNPSGESAHDNVNNPKHYTQGELEVIDILKDKLTKEEFEGFLKGNILKYTFRENIKNGTEDMKKAAWYTAKLIEFREG